MIQPNPNPFLVNPKKLLEDPLPQTGQIDKNFIEATNRLDDIRKSTAGEWYKVKGNNLLN